MAQKHFFTQNICNYQKIIIIFAKQYINLQTLYNIMNYENINTIATYDEIQNMNPKYATFGDNLFWTWANWQTLWIFGKMGERPFNVRYYSMRQKNFKKFRLGEQKISSLYEFNKEKMKSGDICFYCNSNIRKEELTADHVFPRAKGGTDNMDNIILVCKSCNSSKGKKDLIEWYLLNRKEFPPAFILGHYYKQIYHYAVENELMEKPFADVEMMNLPFNSRSILFFHTKISHRWYFDNCISTFPAK